jgi:hypothetical protein
MAHRRHRDVRYRVGGGYVIPTYGMGYYQGVLGNVTSTGTNPPISGPAPPDMQGPSGHLSSDQFVGYPGGYTTDAGNMTGVEAIEGAAGNGGAGGDGSTGGVAQ